MKKIYAVLLTLSLTGCATTQAPESPGHFVYAGVIGAEADVASMKWRYGFKFTIDPATITEIKLSCDPIPGTTLDLKGAPKVDGNGVSFWEGPILPLSKEGTPWLFDPSTTHTDCVATVSRPGRPDAVERAPVTFTGMTKMMTVEQLKTAQDYNSKLKH